ncbi:class I SAM-dependent methyltransferase [Williamsia sterculiae]|uniref:THUMP-like domain-containing protein n=1 Tax=Williamsia sterculiae TaxID=1344003 RepID=A0A1N7G3A6_9NOCA|nr:class I SAM-dependent methyltransferase [Williamsia sterculiae]SIS07057.1 hypothetical protein SAMN05445060_2449 [Williamsia sterculiae]
MAYELTIEDVRHLASADGTEALRVADGKSLQSDSLIADLADLRRRFPGREAALIETVRARRRASGRLRDAGRLLLTDVAAQQATATPVAAVRAAAVARRYPGASVADVTCSIGAELRELTRTPGIGAVIGADLDPVRLAMARHNCPDIPLVRADALAPAVRADVVVADPARRTDGGRTFRLEDLSPPLPDLLDVYAGRPLVVKCAPGLDHRALRERFGLTGEVQVVSLDGGVREAVVWTETVDGVTARATVLRSTGGSHEITDIESDDVAVAEPGRYLFNPDGAVVRAGLVRHFAARHGLWQIDSQIAHLTGDRIPAGERGFEILERCPTAEKHLRRALRDHDCGSLEILVRGVDVDPDRLRNRLRLAGDRPLALVITRIGRTAVGFICRPGVRAPVLETTALEEVLRRAG